LELISQIEVDFAGFHVEEIGSGSPVEKETAAGLVE
jgi:hypothetical protein